MKRKIYSLAAVVAAGTALFLFTPVSGFTQVKSTSSEQSGHVSATPRLAALTSTLAPLQDSFRAVTQKVLPAIRERRRQQVNIPRGMNGVVVGYVPDESSPASIAGLKPGDVITAVNGKSVRTMMDYYRALNGTAKGNVMFTIQRDGSDIRIGLDR